MPLVPIVLPTALNEEPRRDARPLWGAASGGDADAPGRRAVQLLCDLTVLAAASALAVPPADLVSKKRCSQGSAFARQTAMYLAHVAFGLSYSQVGRGFGRDRTTAAHACRLVEDRRDDPAIDALVGALEGACAGLRQRLTRPGAEVRP